MSLPSEKLKIAVIQMISGQNIEANESFLLAKLEEIKNQNIDLVSIPENSLYNRILKGPLPKIDLQRKFWFLLQEWCQQTRASIHIGSVALYENDKTSNATVWIDANDIKLVYRKIHLFDVDVEGVKPIRESDDFVHGQEPAIVELKSWKIGLSICYDLRFSELYLDYAKQGVHLLMVPAAFTVPTGKAHWHILLRARAIESQCYLVAAAQAGEAREGDGIRASFGHSLAIGPWGNILAEASADQAEHFIVELDPSAIGKVRTQIPMNQHRRL